MPPITNVEFRNFKGFKHFSVQLRESNFIAGANNSGKSTIISSFRILEAGLRRARSRKPERFLADGEALLGYEINVLDLDVSTENVHTDYEEIESSIAFRFNNGNLLKLLFPKSGGCYMIPEVSNGIVASPISFEKHFPISLIVVPVLGPLEHNEALVIPSTVQRNLSTSRASRHFRCFWAYNKTEFSRFATMVEATWPGMSLLPPEIAGDTVRMYCLENRMTRELYWAGFGFQIWCQLLSHISRATAGSLLIADEPEVYLHPDVQRQIPLILDSLRLSSVIATHSTEIISQAEPAEIVTIDKNSRSAKRLKDVAEIQLVLDSLGSIQNLLLSRLARHGRVLFFEGDDLKLLRRFAAKIGLTVPSESNAALLKSGGFQGWKRIRDLSWGLRKLNLTMKIGAIFDRDYFPEEELEAINQSLARQIDFSAILRRKEIENYLLVPAAITRAVVEQTSRNNAIKVVNQSDIEEALLKITDELHHETLGQYIAKELDWRKHDKTDPATVSSEVSKRFSLKWTLLETRLEITPGKEVLRRLRQCIQESYGVTISEAKIVSHMKLTDIADELKELIAGLEQFMA